MHNLSTVKRFLAKRVGDCLYHSPLFIDGTESGFSTALFHDAIQTSFFCPYGQSGR
jgi:hypothetical protein